MTPQEAIDMYEPVMPSPYIFRREALRTYILAGRGAITARSEISRKRYTFKFSRPAHKLGGKQALFVRLVTGPDGETTFIGTIWPDGRFAADRKRGTFQAKAAFAWLWQQARLDGGNLPSNVAVWHEGSCGLCGRALTVPESIESGFGPVCQARMMKAGV
ncbi:DUF6011 domain-containing protein [Candidatus Poriferisodalis sp.]|uniref:DUF6011 domain-containing protein n=1 Tax=Candidatus Poriferisodalis sp. TaxID=3101277 RepID=UPI003B017BAF